MKWMECIKAKWKQWQEANSRQEETEFLPAVLEVTETPPSPVGRLALWTLMGLLVAGTLWSFLGEVDEVAVAQGKIVPRGQVKVVQSEYKGVVRAIHVKDGQTVKAGDVLVELDQTVSAAELTQIRKNVAHYQLEVDRLMAEQLDAPFSPQVTADMDPKDVAVQTQLHASRTQEIRNRLALTEAKVREQQAALEIAEINRRKFSELLTIAREREDRVTKLLAENAISYFVFLEYQSKRMELEQNLAAQGGEIAKAQSALQQAQQEWGAIKAERDKDIATKLVEDRKQLLVYQEEIKKAEEKNRQAVLVSPVDGRVTQLAVHTLGGIVTEAQPLMIIVPEGTTLEVEAWAANKDIGFLHEGQRAELKVETFDFQKYGIIDATVSEISADATDDKEKGRVYRMVLQMDKQDMRVGWQDVPLSPGMSVTSEVKIRQKRIIEFFLDPFRKYQSEALRER